jgi:hypothetical protein
VLVALLAGCWRSSPPPAEPYVEPVAGPAPVRANARTPLSEAEQTLQAMEDFADRFCNCHDAQCAQTVMDDLTRWSQDVVRSKSEPPKLSEDEARRAADVGERMGRCMQSAMAGSTSPPPPPSQGP